MRLPYRHQFAAELARADARLRPTFWNGVRRFFHDPRPTRIESASSELPALRASRCMGRSAAPGWQRPGSAQRHAAGPGA